MNRRTLLIILGLILLGIVIAYLIRTKPNINIAKTGESVNFISANSVLAKAREFEQKGKLLDARNLYKQLIAEFPNSGEVINWQKKTEEINMKLLFSPVVTPGSIEYEIKQGDTLFKIAKEFKTTAELIMKSNNLESDKIMPYRKLKIWRAPFTIFIDKSQNTLLLKTNEDILKTYIVSTGMNNSTPTGTFKIVNKLLNPTWFKAGAVVLPNSPENILGSRWLGFDLAGYGIHGTTEPQSLGKQVTQGCVRMLNSEVEQLYAIIPVGTEVIIVD